MTNSSLIKQVHPPLSLDALAFDLADRLRKSLRAAELQQSDIADSLELSLGTVSAWVNGRKQPSPGMLLAWAALTGAPVEWLETGQVARARRAA
jgi:transcriptional regulator with XRE-family HTH domain